MIRKLRSGAYRIHARRTDPETGKRCNPGTFDIKQAAQTHERQIAYFKAH